MDESGYLGVEEIQHREGSGRERREPVTMHDLAPEAVTVWRIKGGLWTAGLTLLVILYDVIELFSGGGFLPFGYLTAAIALLGTLLTIGIPRLVYRHWSYALLDDELHARHGIFTRVYTIVPLHRIQHMDTSQDIIEREYKLAKLIVHTAGTRNSEVVVPGLAQENAEQMRDRLKAYVHRSP